MNLHKFRSSIPIKLLGISLALGTLACEILGFGAIQPTETPAGDGISDSTPTSTQWVLPETPSATSEMATPTSTSISPQTPAPGPTQTSSVPETGGLRPQTCQATDDGSDRMEVKVLLLVYNPTSGPAYGNRTLQQIYSNFPSIDGLVKNYFHDMINAGGGAFCIDVVERYDLNELPPAAVERLAAPDGELLIENYHWVSPDVYFHNVEHLYRYGDGLFVDLFNNGRADYVPILNDSRFGIPEKIDSQAVNMIWILGPPGSGFWEATMAGPGAYWVNGAPIGGIGTSRRFVILAHGLDRGSGLWLEVTAHMVEGILGRVSQGWPKVWSFGDKGPFTDWQRYQLTEWQNYGDELVVPGFAQVGTAHYPPNSPRGSDYAFAFEEVVESYADDWLTYPDFFGVRKPVNRETWNTFAGDYHRGFQYWWFSHIPHNAGSHNGIFNNWWRYIYDVNRDPDAMEPY